MSVGQAFRRNQLVGNGMFLSITVVHLKISDLSQFNNRSLYSKNLQRPFELPLHPLKQLSKTRLLPPHLSRKLAALSLRLPDAI